MRRADNGLEGMLCILVGLGRDHDGTFVRGKVRMRTCTQELGVRGFGAQGPLALDRERARLSCSPVLLWLCRKRTVRTLVEAGSDLVRADLESLASRRWLRSN